MSSVVKISLYEALEKKKIYEKRLESIRAHGVVVARRKGADVDTAGRSIKDVVEPAIQAVFDQSLAIIENRNALNAAINEANAQTKVTIAGKEYSIAAAISRYRGLDVEEKYYKDLLSGITAVKNEIEIQNRKNLSADAVTAYIKNLLGESALTDPNQVDIIEKSKERYREDVTIELYDPLKLDGKIEEKVDEIARFRAEYHTELTRVNIATTIEVEFG